MRRFSNDLKEYADLRNALIHERSDGRPIAEPYDRVVSDIQRLAAVVSNPPRVLPTFQKPVFTIDARAQIADALTFFYPKSLSQVPIMSGGAIVGLLTTNTVSRWLAGERDGDLIDAAAHSVADALKYTEHDRNWRMVARTTLLSEVVDAFDTAEAEGKRLDAVLITAVGKATDALLGIITIHDMPKVLRTLAAKPGGKVSRVRQP